MEATARSQRREDEDVDIIYVLYADPSGLLVVLFCVDRYLKRDIFCSASASHLQIVYWMIVNIHTLNFKKSRY